MRITITPLGGGTPFVLGDDALGLYISDDLPDQSRTVQEVGYFRGVSKVFFDRGNVTNRIPLQVERAAANNAAAMIFKYTHADAVPRQGDVQFNQNGTVRWLKGAVISQVTCVYHAGITTRFRYTITGGQFLTSNPNT